MEDYSKFISPKRQSMPTPKSLVQNGQAVFGTFDREFEEMDLANCRKPAGKLLPHFLNKYRLTLWEATEVHLDHAILLAVVCDMGLFGLTLNVFYDKRIKKAYSWSNNLASSGTTIAPNLINGSIAEARTKNSSIQYVNRFETGRCSLKGASRSRQAGVIEFEFDLERVSLPSVVSIPFGPNKPLYTQKDLFKAKGYVVFNGEKFASTSETTAVVDDHRGYYPYRAHYDWLTTMGKCEIDGEKKYFAFNLTWNQSNNQDDYNENLIWLEGKTSLLPPVRFMRNSGDTVWTVKDEHDMVNITFDVGDMYKMEVHAGVIDIDYHIAFGEIKEGYVRGLDGKKYILDHMMGMGEDKTLRF